VACTSCNNFPGSLGNELKDADQWSSWGIDYLKYDDYKGAKTSAQTRFTAMHDALAQLNHQMFYSVGYWGQDETQLWIRQVANSWRTTTPISNYFSSMKSNFRNNAKSGWAAAPGGWNHPGMLEIGNGGMTETEEMTHMNMWVISQAPLIIGTDLTKASKTTLSILGNSEVLDITKDPLGEQATCLSGCTTTNIYLMLHPEVWSAPLANGDFAVVVVNWGGYSVAKTVTLEELGITEGTFIVRDLWAHKDVNTTSTQWTTPKIPKHGSMFYRVRNSVQTADN
jgi:alpha-galactosidase